MFFPPKPVNLCQSNLLQLQAELKTLCKEARGPLRVFETKGPGADPVFYLRERNLFEAAHEEIAEFFGYETKTVAVNKTLEILERQLRQRIVSIGARGGSKALDGDLPQTLDANGGHVTGDEIDDSEDMRQLLFARALGRECLKPAKGMPMEQVCDIVRACRDEPRYKVPVPRGLSLCKRPASTVIADAVEVWEADDGKPCATHAWADSMRSRSDAGCKTQEDRKLKSRRFPGCRLCWRDWKTMSTSGCRRWQSAKACW